MNYKSTRSNISVSSSQAILDGLASDGGLYIPETLVSIPLKSCIHKTYQEIATIILGAYFKDMDINALKDGIQKAYSSNNFSHPDITGVRPVNATISLLELYYGPTSAFKDQALSIYPYLVKEAMRIHKQTHLSILTATSGDTGKAAMEAIKDVEGLSIVVLYPLHGTSPIQALQMKTQQGRNVYPLGLEGNFDDAQRAVKEFFKDHPGLPVSSANSINIARLLPQVIYYYDAFARLYANEEAVDVYVPTGNFGNALAAYIAREMGLPIAKIIVCTNENDVLYYFFKTGIYDIRDRSLVKTHSPSMDILVASNLERLLSFILKDDLRINALMLSLQNEKYFKLTADEYQQISEIFEAQRTSDEMTQAVIEKTFKDTSILLDPHTATAIPHKALPRPTLVVATASPYKFPDVYRQCFNLEHMDDFEVLDFLEQNTHEPYPFALKALRTQTLLHEESVTKEMVSKVLLEFVEKSPR